MSRFVVQVGRCKGAYHTRHSTDNEAQASMLYNGINAGRGYKKRIKVNGKVVHRTAPDWDFCRR